MTFKITVLCGLLLCGILSVAAQCNECMAKSYVKCLNTTSYKFCKGPSTALTEIGGVQNCAQDTVCTDSANICEPKDDTTIKNVCKGGDGGCTVPDCTAAGDLHCAGPSKYVFCTSAAKKVPLSCPDGQYCSTELFKMGTICATQSVLKALNIKISCGSETPPPAPADLADKCWAAKDTAPGATSFLIGNDCKTYIYCEWSDNQLVGILMNCKSGSRFDSTQKKCVAGSC